MSWYEVGNATGFFDCYPQLWSILDARRWSPRTGFALTVQFSYTTYFREAERIFLTGGFASWPCSSARCHPLFEEERTRNDVWVSLDGANWKLLAQAAPWGERAWHSFVTWSDLTHPFYDVAVATHKVQTYMPPRMWLTGGGYVGSTTKTIVRRIIAYYDLWWTRDGLLWTQVSRSSGSREYLCSSIEAYEYASDKYRGKYGHVMIPFWRIQESQRVCDKIHATMACVTTRIIIPALFFIAGNAGYLDEFDIQPTSDVFASRALVLCDIDGFQCPYPQQVVLKNQGDLRAARRQVHTSIETSKTRAGVCPDPLATCPDPLGTCNAAEQLTFYAVNNVSLILDMAYGENYAHTAINISNYEPHPLSLAARHVNGQGESLIHGFVARLQGCVCTFDERGGSYVGQYSGEYCEQYMVVDGGMSITLKQLTWYFLLIPLGLLLRTMRAEAPYPTG